MNSSRIKECTELSGEILKNFELSEIPINNIILKCLRLCRLLGDEEGVLLFTYESAGYPTEPNGLLGAEAWKIAGIAGRRFFETEKKNGDSQTHEYAKTTSLAGIEELIATQKLRLSAAADPDISLSSANPNQNVFAPIGNANERMAIVSSISNNQNLLQRVRGNLYSYILQIYNKLAYGNIIEDTFTKARLTVNDQLSTLCPKSIGKFVSVYENMDSDNPEDWANAVHSCRRILLDLADALYPPQNTPIIVGKKEIQVGPDQYINRLIQFISSKEGSKTYFNVVGTNLKSIGERLDAIYDAVCKGTHVDVSKDEASRYIIHTYFLISDIISLSN